VPCGPVATAGTSFTAWQLTAGGCFETIDDVLGLPDKIQALLFDLDGVLTQTAKVHAAAWKETFDEFLKHRAEQNGEKFVPFDKNHDYSEYVDGKPREDGVRDFLKSRDVELPEGSDSDGADADTIKGVANQKNERVLKLIHDDGVQPYDGSVRYVHAAADAGVPRAVVSASANCRDVLRAAGIIDLFSEIIDGNYTSEHGLKGKPAPDTYLAGARALGVDPANAAVFEDALAGVASGKAGNFGYVVGVDRVGQRAALQQHGADVVVDDLSELLDR
jgi:beta-phosphoglucomutase family hydrolase